MQYTQAQIDRANAVSLEDFLRTQGETLIKSGREYRWKEHDSLTVRGNKWFRHSQKFSASCGFHGIRHLVRHHGRSGACPLGILENMHLEELNPV